MRDVIITSPSLNPADNVSGVSAVVRLIIGGNAVCRYHHVRVGRRDGEHGLWRRLASLIGSWREWRRALREWPQAAVHYSFPLSTLSVLRDALLMQTAIREGRRMVVHVHGGRQLTAERTPWPLNAVLRHVFAWPVTFIVLSAAERDTIRRRWGARAVEVLPNCVPLPPTPVTRRPPHTPLRIGYLGRIEREKGMGELLEAVAALRDSGTAVSLAMAGVETNAGEWLPRFRHTLGDAFEYVGIVAGTRKDDFLRRLDVFALPSYFEGLPIALLEAMSHGIAPVVTPVGSIPQVVTGSGEAQNGIYIRKRDARGLADAIATLAASPTLLRRLGDAARRTIAGRFTPETYIRRLNDIYAGAFRKP